MRPYEALTKLAKKFDKVCQEVAAGLDDSGSELCECDSGDRPARAAPQLRRRTRPSPPPMRQEQRRSR